MLSKHKYCEEKMLIRVFTELHGLCFCVCFFPQHIMAQRACGHLVIIWIAKGGLLFLSTPAMCFLQSSVRRRLWHLESIRITLSHGISVSLSLSLSLSLSPSTSPHLTAASVTRVPTGQWNDRILGPPNGATLSFLSTRKPLFSNNSTSMCRCCHCLQPIPGLYYFILFLNEGLWRHMTRAMLIRLVRWGNHWKEWAKPVGSTD